MRCCRPGAAAARASPRSSAYLTGLSHVDPIANELLIGRFLNEELTSLPDIDLDFPRDIREMLIPRVHERYGHDRSALVAAFPTYRARGAIRELGKALGLPPGEIERVARGSEGWDAREVARDIESAFGVELGRDSRRRRRAQRVSTVEIGCERWTAQVPVVGRGELARVGARAAAGRGWLVSRRRRMGCRAISPSTRAG